MRRFIGMPISLKKSSIMVAGSYVASSLPIVLPTLRKPCGTFPGKWPVAPVDTENRAELTKSAKFAISQHMCAPESGIERKDGHRF